MDEFDFLFESDMDDDLLVEDASSLFAFDEELLIPPSFDNLSVVSENYVGRTRDIVKLQQTIDKARAKYMREDNPFMDFRPFVDKDITRIGDAIADAFNFKVVDFSISPDMIVNACTYPCGYSVERFFQYGASDVNLKNGYKFKNKTMSSVIMVTKGAWCNKAFTDEEICALILHEVGHNFNHVVNDFVKTYMSTIVIVQLITSFGLSYFIVDPAMKVRINKIIRSSKILSLLGLGLKTTIAIKQWIRMELNVLIDSLSLGTLRGPMLISNFIRRLEKDPLSIPGRLVNKIGGTGMEILSDNFAADFGYGAQLSSALMKMDLDKRGNGTAVQFVRKSIPIWDDLYQVLGVPSTILMGMFGTHPMNPKRVSIIVNNLNEELNKANLSPAMKKEIQAQIDDVKDVVDLYTKAGGEKFSLGKGDAAKFVMRHLITFNKDPRNAIEKLFSTKDIDRRQL